MIDTSADGVARVRRLGVAGGILLVLQAAAVGVVLTRHPPVILPVTWSSGGEQRLLAQIDAGIAAVVLLIVVALARLVIRPSGSRRHDFRWVEFSVTSSVTVFLVAQLNGVTEVTTLVSIYALTSGMSLLAILQERTHVRAGHPMLPLCFGAAIGIVPWGLIAFTQIGSGVVGDAPSVTVRVLTLVMLAFAAAFATLHWREQRRLASGGDPLVGELVHIVLSVVAVSVFAWLVVLGVVVPGA